MFLLYYETKNLLKLHFFRHSLKSEPGSTSESHVTIEWGIPSDEKAGKYRIVYQGDKLDPEWKNVTSFTGISRVFEITKQ